MKIKAVLRQPFVPFSDSRLRWNFYVDGDYGIWFSTQEFIGMMLYVEVKVQGVTDEDSFDWPGCK